VGSAGDDHRAARGATHLEDVHLEVLSDPIVLAGELFAHRQHRLHATPHVEDHGRVGRAMHDARHDLALAARVLLVDDVALRLAQPLTVDLPRRLGRDPSELRLGDVLRDANFAADPHRRVDLLRIGDRHLELRLGDLLRCREHLELPEDADVPGLRVYLDDHILGRIAVPAVGGFDRLLESLDQDLLGNALLGVQLEQSSDKIAAHDRSPRLVTKKRTWDGEPTPRPCWL
jgi:hypothetical protein